MVIILDTPIRLPGKDATPKINTNMTAFYSKLADRKQLSNIQKMIDDAWNDAATIDVTTPTAHKIIKDSVSLVKGLVKVLQREHLLDLLVHFKKTN